LIGGLQSIFFHQYKFNSRFADVKGALTTIVPANSSAYKNGLQKGDVIVKIKENVVQSVIDLLQTVQKVKWMGVIEITIMRNQSLQTINLNVKE
jgi:S1-C subfamily serine protease